MRAERLENGMSEDPFTLSVANLGRLSRRETTRKPSAIAKPMELCLPSLPASLSTVIHAESRRLSGLTGVFRAECETITG